MNDPVIMLQQVLDWTLVLGGGGLILLWAARLVARAIKVFKRTKTSSLETP